MRCARSFWPYLAAIPGTPFSRMASCKPPIWRLAYPDFNPKFPNQIRNSGLSSDDETFVEPERGIHHAIRGKACHDGFARCLAEPPRFGGIRKQARDRGCQSNGIEVLH